MKTRRFGIIMLVACMTLFVACKDDNATDYRDTWVGTYVGDTQYHYSANGGENVIDTVYVNDSLTVAKIGDDNLVIGFRSQSFQVNCTKEGVFNHDNYPHGGCQGQCYGDSVYFMSEESEQGRSATYTFSGRKI